MKNKRASIRVNVVLDGEGNAWLDRHAGRASLLDRSKALRALVAALRASGLDLARFKSEQDLAVIATCGLRSAASQFPAYTLPKGKPGSAGAECVS
jgi:hypothetical protein